MISFRELLFEDPKNVNDKTAKTLMAAFFTTFVFDADTILSIVE